MDASSELHIPIIVVVQANRGGIVDKDSKDIFIFYAEKQQT